MHECSADSFEYGRELPWIGSYAFHHGLDFLPETPAQAGGLVFVPVLRADKFPACGLGEFNTEH